MLVGHRLILYHIIDGQCVPHSGFYSYFDNYLEVVCTGIFPPILMSVLAFLLIRSVRNVIKRRIVPINHLPSIINPKRTILQQMDSKLTFMLILQSIITITTYLPYAAELIYTNISRNWSKSSLQKAQEKIFTELMHLLSYVFFASSFYVSIISNIGFRRQIKSFFSKNKNNQNLE